MARPVVLSNGELHVGLNEYGMVHDFYFPYVGLENHSAGSQLRHKIGIWVDSKIHWLDNGNWNISSTTAEGALIGHTTASNNNIGVILQFDDTVASDISVLIRNIHIINNTNHTRDIRLFVRQAFAIGDSRSNTDTAQYLPDSNALLHYRGRRAFVIAGKTSSGAPFDQHAIGLFGIEGREGTYRDADDGELACNFVEHGRVDSTLRFKVELAAHESTRIHYWIAAGKSTREALYVHKSIQETGVDSLIQSTAAWWHDWLEPARRTAMKLPVERRKRFLHSALVIKAHIDKRGAIIASTDSSMLNYSRDAYGYCWPRDGSYVLWPLIRLGYTNEPRRFFEFCKRALHSSGYLMHKYQADGALGSSWHPYVHGSINAPPIQEDETALTLFMFSQFYHMQKDDKLLQEFYEPFVVRMADFLAGYIDETTGLPKPSYDLWEENFIISTYTTSTVFAALEAAADLADLANDQSTAVRWRAVAEDIRRAAHKQLFDSERGCFYKGLIPTEDGYQPLKILDTSSLYGAFMFGLFEVNSEEVQSTLKVVKSTFNIDHGVPRYENDSYYRTDNSVTGNWWIITRLWLGQLANELHDSAGVEAALAWADSRTSESLMMSEQFDAATGQAVSVSPLVWSHAEYMATLLDSVSNTESHNDS